MEAGMDEPTADVTGISTMLSVRAQSISDADTSVKTQTSLGQTFVVPGGRTA
jgi:hypothetical protein